MFIASFFGIRIKYFRSFIVCIVLPYWVNSGGVFSLILEFSIHSNCCLYFVKVFDFMQSHLSKHIFWVEEHYLESSHVCLYLKCSYNVCLFFSNFNILGNIIKRHLKDNYLILLIYSEFCCVRTTDTVRFLLLNLLKRLPYLPLYNFGML